MNIPRTKYLRAEEVYLHDKLLDSFILWMIPHWVKPNFFTIVRLILVPVVVYVNYMHWYRIGIPLFLFAAFTDAIDGSLARTRNQITNFGKLMDPVADKLLIGSMMVLLVMRYIDYYIGLVVIALEIIFMITATVVRALGKTPQSNLWGKLKMVLQCIAVFIVLLGLSLENAWMFAAASWIFGAAIIFAVISLFFHGI